MTRAEVKRWFQPITDFCKQAIAGEVDTVKGYPITYIATRRVYSRVDLCLEGIKESCHKVLPNFNYDHLERVRKKLTNGIMLDHKDIEDLNRTMRELEDRLIRIPYEQIMSAVRDIMIAVHLRMQANENNTG